ncbi:hypothetical protein C0J52_13084 [Blattella germanica]|nr:hypothetical protein C0J52_13084 [Blattella germanica]
MDDQFVLDFTAPKKNIEIKNWHVEKCEENGREDHLVLKNAVVYTKDNGDLGLSGYVRVTMKKKTLGLWVKLPCIKDFGSCTYDDLCEYGYSYHTPCPNSFARDHVPCRCPIDKGAYSIPEDVHVPMKSTRWAGIAKGDYRAKVHFIHDEKEIACYIAIRAPRLPARQMQEWKEKEEEKKTEEMDSHIFYDDKCKDGRRKKRRGKLKRWIATYFMMINARMEGEIRGEES